MDIDETGATESFQSQTFKVARNCVRKSLKETDVTDEEWQNSLHRGGPWAGQMGGGAAMVPILFDGTDKDQEMAGGEKPAESGGQPTEETGEPSMDSPRLIPVPDSPPHSAQPSPDPALEDTGHLGIL